VFVEKKDIIISEIGKEKEKFFKALLRGNREIERILARKKKGRVFWEEKRLTSIKVMDSLWS